MKILSCKVSGLSFVVMAMDTANIMHRIHDIWKGVAISF
jgi:hypothetical protein